MQAEQQLVKCIEDGISDHLGDGIRIAFFSFLREDFHISRDDIARKPELLRECLEKMFGTTSGGFVEKFILQKVNQTFHLTETDMVVAFKKALK